MLTFDSVRLRLEREQPLTLLEFNYMVMQAYDFLELSRRYACRLQMGGSDQWGNIVNGVELGRRIDGSAALRADDAADHDGLGPEDGQDRRGGAVWLDGDTARPPSSTGSSGATPRTPMSAASCGSSPSCRSTRSTGFRAAPGGRDQRGQEGAGLRGHAALPRSRRGRAAAAAARAVFEGGDGMEACRS